MALESSGLIVIKWCGIENNWKPGSGAAYKPVFIHRGIASMPLIKLKYF